MSINFASTMSDTEALMWRVEADPFLSSNVANLMFLDRRPNIEWLANQINAMIADVPRFAQRVVERGPITPPGWEHVEGFDAHDHLRRIRLPRGTTRFDVMQIAARLNAEPLDRTKPLWEFILLEGLPGGSAAMVQRIHHTVADGEAAIRFSLGFLAPERQPTEPSAPLRAGKGSPLPPLDSEPGPAGSSTFDPLDLGSIIATAGAAIGSVLSKVANDPAVLTRIAHQLPHLSSQISEGIDLAKLVVTQLHTDPAHSPLWTERSLHRYLGSVDIGIAEAKRVAKHLGGTLNDVFLTGVLGGAGRYHRIHNVFVGDLRVAIPVSTRTDASGANSFVPSRALLPAGIQDPIERFAEVHDRLALLKHDPTFAHIDKLLGIAGMLPQPVLHSIARQQTKSIDFAASNVRAAPITLFMAGAQVLANYALGPLAGTAFNITLLSYADTLCMGIHIDTLAVTDPELLRSCVEESFAELLAVAN